MEEESLDGTSSSCHHDIITLDDEQCWKIHGPNHWMSDQHDTTINCMRKTTERIRYRKGEKAGEWTIDQVESEMGFIYTNRVLLQRKHFLRNYLYWGFSNESNDLFPTSTDLEWEKDIHAGFLHPSVEIQYISDIAGWGLFTHTEIIKRHILLGEYTGVLLPSFTTDHDSYGLIYPSIHNVYTMHISAREYGNCMRCINHSSDDANAEFYPVLHRGMIHIAVRTLCPIKAGVQILIDYGPSYWSTAPILPIALTAPE